MRESGSELETEAGANHSTIPPERFESTHWSAVQAAQRSDDTAARAALGRLCRTYWYPLYAFIRRQGYGPEDAQDLTQGFFARLLEHHALASVDQAKGKFRSFLLASLRHFLVNEWERSQAQKRGGGCRHVSLDMAAAEMRYALEPATPASLDKLFDRNWALTLLELAFTRLRDEQAAPGQAPRFERLRDCLTGEPDAPHYADLAAQFGMSEDAVKTAVSRLRRRYRELLREEIARTAGNPAEIEEELRHLFAALAT